MWLSLPEPVRMNRIVGEGSVTSGVRCDGVDSWGLLLRTYSDEVHSELNVSNASGGKCRLDWQSY
jgi:hypothetical protein